MIDEEAERVTNGVTQENIQRHSRIFSTGNDVSRSHEQLGLNQGQMSTSLYHLNDELGFKIYRQYPFKRKTPYIAREMSFDPNSQLQVADRGAVGHLPAHDLNGRQQTFTIAPKRQLHETIRFMDPSSDSIAVHLHKDVVNHPLKRHRSECTLPLSSRAGEVYGQAITRFTASGSLKPRFKEFVHAATYLYHWDPILAAPIKEIAQSGVTDPDRWVNAFKRFQGENEDIKDSLDFGRSSVSHVMAILEEKVGPERVRQALGVNYPQNNYVPSIIGVGITGLLEAQFGLATWALTQVGDRSWAQQIVRTLITERSEPSDYTIIALVRYMVGALNDLVEYVRDAALNTFDGLFAVKSSTLGSIAAAGALSFLVGSIIYAAQTHRKFGVVPISIYGVCIAPYEGSLTRSLIIQDILEVMREVYAGVESYLSLIPHEYIHIDDCVMAFHLLPSPPKVQGLYIKYERIRLTLCELVKRKQGGQTMGQRFSVGGLHLPAPMAAAQIGGGAGRLADHQVAGNQAGRAQQHPAGVQVAVGQAITRVGRALPRILEQFLNYGGLSILISFQKELTASTVTLGLCITLAAKVLNKVSGGIMKQVFTTVRDLFGLQVNIFTKYFSLALEFLGIIVADGNGGWSKIYGIIHKNAEDRGKTLFKRGLPGVKTALLTALAFTAYLNTTTTPFNGKNFVGVADTQLLLGAPEFNKVSNFLTGGTSVDSTFAVPGLFRVEDPGELVPLILHERLENPIELNKFYVAEQFVVRKAGDYMALARSTHAKVEEFLVDTSVSLKHLAGKPYTTLTTMFFKQSALTANAAISAVWGVILDTIEGVAKAVYVGSEAVANRLLKLWALTNLEDFESAISHSMAGVLKNFDSYKARTSKDRLSPAEVMTRGTNLLLHHLFGFVDSDTVIRVNNETYEQFVALEDYMEARGAPREDQKLEDVEPAQEMDVDVAQEPAQAGGDNGRQVISNVGGVEIVDEEDDGGDLEDGADGAAADPAAPEGDPEGDVEVQLDENDEEILDLPVDIPEDVPEDTLPGFDGEHQIPDWKRFPQKVRLTMAYQYWDHLCAGVLLAILDRIYRTQADQFPEDQLLHINTRLDEFENDTDEEKEYDPEFVMDGEIEAREGAVAKKESVDDPVTDEELAASNYAYAHLPKDGEELLARSQQAARQRSVSEVLGEYKDMSDQEKKLQLMADSGVDVSSVEAKKVAADAYSKYRKARYGLRPPGTEEGRLSLEERENSAFSAAMFRLIVRDYQSRIERPDFEPSKNIYTPEVAEELRNTSPVANILYHLLMQPVGSDGERANIATWNDAVVLAISMHDEYKQMFESIE